jgi:tetratricopeptide (TPR) repeat protein
MGIFRALAFVFASALFAVSARAEWHEASSDHFLVIADQNEKDVRAFSERLEKFHGALLSVLGRDDIVPSPSNRVTIYVVQNARKVQKLAGDKSGFLQGFYQARAGGSLAFTSRVDPNGTAVDQSEQTLLHEYAHHVMHSNSEWSTPRWMSEGFAEFLSTARFDKDGGVGLGLPAQQRAAELAFARDVPIEALLDAATYEKFKTKAYDEFYGRSWLLYHYLLLGGKRSGQLTEYEVALANGATEMEAATKVFGDLKQLEKEMNAYLRLPKLRFLPIPAAKLKLGTITIRKMRVAEAAIMPLILESKRGVTEEMAKALLPRVQAVAAKFPDDPAVMAALAEAEHDAQNFQAAIVAADKALTANPAQVNAHVQKIYALSRIASDADEPEPAWKSVRKAVTALNKLEPDHPIPLIYYYRSMQASDKGVTELAAQGLERALQLAPYDKDVRWQVVQQMINDEDYGVAYRTLMPLANDPHNRGDDNPAIALLAKTKVQWEEQVEKAKSAQAVTPAKSSK